MSTPSAMLAVQFDRATVGLQASLMRDQIISNAESLFMPGRSATPTSYTVAIAEHKHPHVELLQYTASLVRSDGGGARTVMLSPKDATIWGAYRGLLRLTMKELGRREDAAHERRRRRKRVAVVDTSSSDGSTSPVSESSGGDSPMSERSSGGGACSPTSSVSSVESPRSWSAGLRVKKSLRVLGLSRFE